MYYNFVDNLRNLSKCEDRGVACIICDKTLLQVLSIGVNGGPKGSDIDCLCKAETKYSCIHAEANALVKLNTHVQDKVLICTLAPCSQCASMIVNEPGGFYAVLYITPWKEQLAIDILKYANIKVGRLTSDGVIYWQ